MMTDRLRGDRLWGGALVAAVVLQLVYLYFDLVAMSAPAYDAPLAEWRAMLSANRDLIRWHILIPLFLLFALFLPASVALKRRLSRSVPAESVWPDLVVPGAVLATMIVILSEMMLATIGLVPTDELSDSSIHVLMMANAYSIFVAANLACALFAGPASLAMLQARPSPRWLGWWGVTTASLSSIGALWLVSGDAEGLLFGLTILSRAMWLAWVTGAGVWLYRGAAVVATDDAASATGLPEHAVPSGR